MDFVKFLRRNAPWLSAGILMTFMSSFGQTFFISIFAGEIRLLYGLSHGQWGGIYTLGTSLSAFAMIWSGVLTDHFRVRVLGPVTLIGLALACVSMAWNVSVVMLPVIIFALRFFGQGMSSHIAVVAMARWYAASRGRALSIAALGFSAGEAVLPVSFVALMAFTDWHNLWLVAAVICLAGIFPLIFLLRLERTPKSLAQETSNTGMQNKSWNRKEALMHPLFWFMVPALLGPAAFNTAFFFHQVHFAEIKGWTHVYLVSFFPAYTALSIAAMVASGWALDRWGTARLMPFYQLPMIASFLIFSLTQGGPSVFLGFFFLSLTTGANSTLPNAFWAEFFGTAHIGAIKAMAAAVMVLGSAIGPGITGVLVDLGIGLERQFLWVAAYFLIATGLMWLGISRAAQTLGSQRNRRRYT